MVLRKISTCILFVAIASYGAIAQEQLTISQHDALSELENNLEDSVVEMGNFEVDGLYYKIISPNAVKVVKAYEGHEYEGDIVIPSSITYSLS